MRYLIHDQKDSLEVYSLDLELVITYSQKKFVGKNPPTFLKIYFIQKFTLRFRQYGW